jgi:hypothetical protein
MMVAVAPPMITAMERGEDRDHPLLRLRNQHYCCCCCC